MGKPHTTNWYITLQIVEQIVAFNAVFYCSYSRLSFHGMQLLEQL